MNINWTKYPKTKEDFEKWMRCNIDGFDQEFSDGTNFHDVWVPINEIAVFKELDFAFQWGIWLEYFDSIELVVTLFNADKPDKWGTYILEVGEKATLSPYKYNSRKEAQISALEKVFELREKQLSENDD